MPSPTGPSLPPPHDVDIDLEVRGSIPPGLSGRLLGIGRDGAVHSVELRAGGPASYRSRPAPAPAAVHNIVVFGGSILAFGDDTLAYELSADLDTFRPVDLAGQVRPLASYPKHDPATSDLHLVARGTGGTHAHVVVSAGALTRHSRQIIDAPNRITDLALTRDRIVFLTDGMAGVAPRDGEPRTTWMATGAAAASAVHAHDDGDSVVLLALTPSLERWTLHDGAVERVVLDPVPRSFAHLTEQSIDEMPLVVWTTGGWTVGHHDLAGARHEHHSLWPNVPGDLVFVPDAARPGHADGGWLVGFVHDMSRGATELRVIDAVDIAGPQLATVRIPRPIRRGFRCTWIPPTLP